MSTSSGLHFQLLTSWFASREENAGFDIQNVCMTAFFKRLSDEMGLLPPKPWRKVNVEYGPDKRAHVMYGPPPVWTLESQKDIREFFCLGEQEKRRYGWGLMKEVWAACAPSLGDDVHRFDSVFAEMERQEFRNHYLWKKKLSKDRRLQVSIFVEYTSQWIDVTAVLEERGGDVSRHAVARIAPNEFAIHEMLGSIKFDPDVGPAIVSRSGRDVVPISAK